MPSECQAVLIQIRANILSALNWIQTVLQRLSTDDTGTVLPAKSDSDDVFCLQSYQGLESIDHVCINPICRIGIIHM